MGLLLKERICSHGEQILSSKSNPKFEVKQLAPIKLRIKMIFDLSEGMENCTKSGKSQGILRWMISGNPEFANSTFFHFCHFKY